MKIKIQVYLGEIMINGFKLKRIFSPLIASAIATSCFFVGIYYYDIIVAFILMFVGILIGTLVGSVISKNPFTPMLEGKGIIAFNLDSTGVMKPFMVSLDNPYIKGKYGSKQIKDIFNRSTTLNLSKPIMNKTPAKFTDDGKIHIILDEDEYNKGRFGLFHYPCLIWNDQIKSILTKDFFSEQEKTAFAEHGILYLNRTMEELTQSIRDFGRYIVENIKPMAKLMNNKGIVIIILIVFVVIILVMFGGPIFSAIQNTLGGNGNIIQDVSNAAAITPR